MHELALIEAVVTMVSDRLGDRKVSRVRLEVGQMTAVVPDAIRFGFDVCTRGTNLEGAVLEIVDVPAEARCRACGERLRFSQLVPVCLCGSADLEWLAGQELRVKEVEVV